MTPFLKRISAMAMMAANAVIPKKKDQICFYTKPDFSDNGRAVYEELRREGLDKRYHSVWLVQGDVSMLRQRYPDMTFCAKNSIRGFFQFARSKYVIRSHTLYIDVRSPRQNVSLLWHGMGIKGPIDFRRRDNTVDMVSVTSDFYRFKLATRIGCPVSRVAITGLPRNDFMFAGKAQECLRALPKVAALEQPKTLLWMPTYHTNPVDRGVQGKSYDLGLPVVLPEDLPKLNDALREKNMVLLVKLHPHVTGIGSIHALDYSNIQVFSDKDLPPELSLYHLIGGVDALLTDYSSVFTDFMLLDRPIGFIYDDFEEYKATQGFAFERVELMMPGEHIHTAAELLAFIDGIAQGKDSHAQERRTLNRFINFYNDGNNSRRVIERIGLDR